MLMTIAIMKLFIMAEDFPDDDSLSLFATTCAVIVLFDSLYAVL